MQANKIKQGEIYRLKSSPNYGYVKVLCVLKPKQTAFYKDINGVSQMEINERRFTIVKCLHSTDKDFDFGFVRIFLPREIIEESK